MTKHSRDDALTDRQFERLLQGARTLPDPFAFEATLVIQLAGILGMRGGEIAHLSAEWIDTDRRVIEIPEHDPCTKGKDGGVCGYCRERAREHVEAINISVDEAMELVREEFDDVELPEEKVRRLAEKKQEEHNITMEQALSERWEPKTENGARLIPYDFNTRTQLAIEEFVENYTIFPKARVAVNRRVDEAVDAADIDARVYPHSLRATAASSMALHDVSAYGLMGMLGWKDLETARNYIKASDETAAKEVRSAFR